MNLLYRLRSILNEDASPLRKRFEWLLKTTDPITAFMVMDVVLTPHAYTGLSCWSKNKKMLLDDSRMLYAMAAGNDPDSPESSGVDDSVATEYLAVMVRDFFDSGLWYDGSRLPDRSPLEKMIGWILKVVKSRDDKAIAQLVRYGGEIADWFSVVRPDLMSLTFNQALYRSRKWHADMARKQAGISELDTSSLEKVADLGDGVEIFLLAPNDLKAEGAAMRHCIGSVPRYKHDMGVSRASAYSIRRNKKRLYTVFCDTTRYRPRIDQFKGKANLLPGKKGTDTEAAMLAIEWFRSNGYTGLDSGDLAFLHEQEKWMKDLNTLLASHQP